MSTGVRSYEGKGEAGAVAAAEEGRGAGKGDDVGRKPRGVKSFAVKFRQDVATSDSLDHSSDVTAAAQEKRSRISPKVRDSPR